MSEGKKEKDPRTVTLKGVRLSFTDALVEKRATSTENPDRKTHHLNVINEKSGPFAKHFDDNHKKIMGAIKAACEKEWKNPEKYKDIIEDSPKRVCYRDGSKFKNREGQIYTGYEGNKAFSASTPGGGQRRPRFIDRYKNILIAPGDAMPTGTKLTVKNITLADIQEFFYSGCYADVTVSFYGTKKGSDGVFCSVDMIRSYQQGERVAGGYVFEDDDLDELDDFEDDLDDLDDDSGSSSDDDDI